ncbi:MAG: hypothetical protein ABSB32_08165 [Thermodesulfobacteriota bacterium]|jgi:ribosomal protein L18E
MKRSRLINIREEGIRAYIERFHETLDLISGRFFKPDQAKNLLHRSLLPAKIICYVSTQFGVAFEYSKAAATTIETIGGSARIEDLIVKAPKRLREIGPLFNVGGSSILMAGLTLADGFPFRLSDTQANVTFKDVRFLWDALKWVRNVEYAEVYGDRRAERWTMAEAESRAKDEVLSALFFVQQANTKRVNLYEYISSFREKTVLVLGSYSDAGKERLATIVRILEELGYEPILIKDVPDFEHYDLSQKVTAIGTISRFVVIDDSEPSGHLAEIEICRNNRWVTVLLRAGGHGASWMTAGASFSSKVILEKDYELADARRAISESVQWAEAKLEEMKAKLNLIYPWRTES